MKQILKVWNRPFFSLEGNTFSVGQCVTVWVLVLVALWVLGMVGQLERMM